MLNHRLLLFSVFFACALQGLSAQKIRVVTELVKDAEQEMNAGNLRQAEHNLREAIRQKEDFVTAHRLLGLVLARSGEFEKATRAYERAIGLNPKFSRALYFECAEAYIKTGHYQKALDYLAFYQNGHPTDFKSDEQAAEMAYDLRLERVSASCRYALAVDYGTVVEPATSLGDNVNTPFEDYMPALSADGTLLMFTSRKTDEDILFCKKEGEQWSAPQPANFLNTSYNEGMARFTGCGARIFFAGCNREEGRGGCDIYFADLGSDENPGAQAIKGFINERSWDSQPTLSCDASLLVFASNREGGVGGSDLWYSRLQNGIWSEPTNLGPTINTDGDEESPCLAPDGLTLYFSSDGHPGFGDADLFRTVLDENSDWSTPQNLGRSINTAYRETGFCLSPDESIAYFASARPGGRGGLDLYQVGLPRALSPKASVMMICGTVYARGGGPLEVPVRVRQDGRDIRVVHTDKEGRFSVCVPNGAIYSFIVEKKGYETYVNADHFGRTEERPVGYLAIVLEPLGSSPPPAPAQPTVVVAPPEPPKETGGLSAGTTTLYFESSSAAVLDAEKNKLWALMHRFGEPGKVQVKVVGYADEIGDHKENVMLSLRRAENVANLLEIYGVSKAAISIEGKGEAEGSPDRTTKRRVEVFIYVTGDH